MPLTLLLFQERLDDGHVQPPPIPDAEMVRSRALLSVCRLMGWLGVT